MNASDVAIRRLSLLASLHFICAMVTWLSAWGLVQIARTTYGAYMASAIPADQERFAMLAIVALSVGGVLCAVHGGLMLWARRLIQTRQKFSALLGVAALNAIIFPVGTLLFLLTFFWLSNEDVRSEFGLTTPQTPAR